MFFGHSASPCAKGAAGKNGNVTEKRYGRMAALRLH
jgi:hypothetical protein